VDHLEVRKEEISDDELRRLLKDYERVGSVQDDLHLGEKDENRVYRLKILAAHEHEPGKIVLLDLAEESDGTRRLLNLIPMLHYVRRTGAVYFIDEIDRSLHPILVKEFLGFFLKSGGLGQIIVTTHESNLLDQDLLRRDEIWFAEKDQTGATRLYSLLDFTIRDDAEIRKHYLQGRFGAVPFQGDLENLRAKTDRPE
jgi:hypothetical protein